MTKDGRSEMAAFVRRRIDALLTRPDAWGPPQAVELQLLLLLEMWNVVTGAPPEEVDGVSTRYDAYLDERVKGPPVLLTERLGLTTRADGRFTEILKGFAQQEMSARRLVSHAGAPALPRRDQVGLTHLAEA